MEERILEQLNRLVEGKEERPVRARRAAELIRSAGGFRWVGLYDVHPDVISAIAWTGEGAPAHPYFPASQGLCGAAVQAGKTVVVGDVTKDPRYLTTFVSTRSEIIIPVIRDGRVVGLVDVESERLDAFGEGDRLFLEECASAISDLWNPASS